MPVCFAAVVPLLSGAIAWYISRFHPLDAHEIEPLTSTVSASAPQYRFMGDAADLVVGRPEAAATGIFDFILCDEHTVHEQLQRGTACVVDEWERAYQADKATQSDLDNLRYVLEREAGCSDERFQYGWKRDRAQDGSRLPKRTRGDGTGMTLEDFAQDKHARQAGLTPSHVLALRLYTTSAFRSINNPLRRLQRFEVGTDTVSQPTRKLERAHPLPCTVVLIYDGLKKLRAATDTKQASNQNILSDDTTIEPFDGIEDPDLHSRKPGGWRQRMMRGAISIGASARSSIQERTSALLQTNEGNPSTSSQGTVLWRGLKNLRATESFMLLGGSPHAPCYTTPDREIGLRMRTREARR
jgi:hypothetical protein